VAFFSPNGTELDIKNFRQIFAQGLKDIEEAKAYVPPPGRSEAEDERSKRIVKTTEDAVEALLKTRYVDDLWKDVDLNSVFSDLEKKLGALAEAMLEFPDKGWKKEHKAIQWAQQAQAKLERKFLFWGRLSEILIYYCDEGNYFSSLRETTFRDKVIEHGEEMVGSIQKILNQRVCQLYYDKPARKRLQDMIDCIRDFQKSLKSGLSAYPLSHTSLLVESQNTIKAQFIESVSRLCYELFGNLTSGQMIVFLRLRPETDAKNGYLQSNQYVVDYKLTGKKVRTPRKVEHFQKFDPGNVLVETLQPDSEKRLIREDMHGALARAKLVAVEEDWPIREILEYFVERKHR
jgi:hypothetical protein